MTTRRSASDVIGADDLWSLELAGLAVVDRDRFVTALRTALDNSWDEGLVRDLCLEMLRELGGDDETSTR